jgi:hypothetical protein
MSITEIELPSRSEPYTENVLPRRVQYFRDVVDPNEHQSSTLKLDPSFEMPYTLKLEPTRSHRRHERPLPKWLKSRIEQLEPIFIRPYTDIV